MDNFNYRIEKIEELIDRKCFILANAVINETEKKFKHHISVLRKNIPKEHIRKNITPKE